MRVSFFLSGWVLLFCTSVVDASDRFRISHLDVSDGEVPGYRIIYVTNVTDERKSSGSVLVVLTSADASNENASTFDVAYRFARERGTDTAVLLKPRKIERAFEKDSSAGRVTTVELTAEQFEKARSIIETTAKRTDPDFKPAKGFIGCVRGILRMCKMRTPYTSPYRVPNPMEWVGDIPAYSMDLEMNSDWVKQ